MHEPATDLPDHVSAWLDQVVVEFGDVLRVEKTAWLNFCAAIGDGCAHYWREGADAIAPPALLPSWVIEHEWYPDTTRPKMRTLELHFILKDALDLPYGVVTEVDLDFRAPVRAGDSLSAQQILRYVGPLYQTKMGMGRRWTIEVRYHRDDGELAGLQTLKFVSYRKQQD
jgi:hypothetical protein